MVEQSMLCDEINIPYQSITPEEIEDFVEINKKPSFNNLLFNYIDKAGASDSHISMLIFFI
ncbi:hypothetical protein Amet_1990 [Alkaliphilus metalliredigens QYMF]|uniref:Uncharacterized protein n=1 Tax=Alkaliphilus metalliredigens (strain QYMF) TaxID=293826 RepID=A6TPN5_ALKMQ|nr:hypothetical protein [Alkaliphilus metalliredigens]ABR48153.1 hypothetical protein Amet_1990 [Alkaliphilus metalliredigens QYMF]